MSNLAAEAATKKLVSRIVGGLGNQLFCYAAARRLSLVNGMDLVLDDTSGFSRDFSHRRVYQLDHFHIQCRRASAAERLEPLARVRRYVKRRVNHWLPFQSRAFIQQEGFDFDARLLDVRPQGNLHLEGYWQSEAYFSDVADVIRNDLRIRAPGDSANQQLAMRIRDGASVALHMRFFDPPAGGGINNAPGDYYTRAIARMEMLAPDAHYFVFSDQPGAVRGRIALPDHRLTVVSHNTGDAMAYADLWLMTLCRHFIIANSTFSWWGAWLAGQPAKKIIAPGFEMRQGKMWWGFKGLLPDDWIRL